MLNINEIVPWGRNLEEYRSMFNLSAHDLDRHTLCFADGTGSFNFEMRQQGRKVISLDPVYGFDKEILEQKFYEALEYSYEYVSQLTGKEQEDLLEKGKIRETATGLFLEDFETGKAEGRYLPYKLPDPIPFGPHTFELGLCAHFLFLYDRLGVAFHHACLAEMLRVCREVRIFPLINQLGEPSEILLPVITCLKCTHCVEQVDVEYGFGDLGYQMLRIRPKKN